MRRCVGFRGRLGVRVRIRGVKTAFFLRWLEGSLHSVLRFRAIFAVKNGPFLQGLGPVDGADFLEDGLPGRLGLLIRSNETAWQAILHDANCRAFGPQDEALWGGFTQTFGLG